MGSEMIDAPSRFKGLPEVYSSLSLVFGIASSALPVFNCMVATNPGLSISGQIVLLVLSVVSGCFAVFSFFKVKILSEYSYEKPSVVQARSGLVFALLGVVGSFIYLFIISFVHMVP